METINERIVQVIKERGIKKTQLAKMLSISDAAVSKLCSGQNSPSNQTISIFCGKLGVDEVWLRTGEGSPTTETSREEQIAEILNKAIRGGSEKEMFIRALCNVPEEHFHAVCEFIIKAAEALAAEIEAKK